MLLLVGVGGTVPEWRDAGVVAQRGGLLTGDTVYVFGPTQYDGSTGQGQTYVERFTATVTPGRLYSIRLVNGAPDGTRRASKVTVQLNGYEVVSQSEVTQAVAELSRTVAVTEVDTLRVTVAGSGDPYISISILSTTDHSFNVFGPVQYSVTTGSTTSYSDTIALPSGAAAPYRIYVTNGASDGSQRVTSGAVTLAGAEIVSPAELTSAVGSLTKIVTLTSSNSLGVTVNGAVDSYLTIRFTATDTTRPALTITTPTPNTLTNQSSIEVAGTIADQTATAVTVNGVVATVTSNASYAAIVPLPSDGSHLLAVTATDATGRSIDSTRTVIRDTEAPALTVSAPADSTITSDASIAVNGTAADAHGVTVDVNGTPLVLGVGGAFSGSVALAEGANVLLVMATDGAGNAAVVTRTVIRDATPPVLTLSAPGDGTTATATTVTVAGNVSDASAVTLTINGDTVAVDAGGAFTASVALQEGPNVITATAVDAAGHMTTATRTVNRELVIPPDPATVAPSLNRSVATTVFGATEFIHTGADPIQTGVTAGTISPARAGVLRGRVLNRDGQALSGVTLSILDHPEFGQTVSRLDGGFDLVVNGGATLTVVYAKPGFLSSQRSVEAPLQDYTTLDDVVLIPLDTQVTVIDFTAPVQVARGSPIVDAAGSRRATALFKQGTQATMVLPSGQTSPLTSLSVRATEYTVGDAGPAAMPGRLPPTSGYTYAVELSVDEALAAGATDVQFSQPVPLYVENFLNFPVGTNVPLGYYDRRRAMWVPANDGRVIKVLSVSAGRANLDITGDGVADDALALAGLGIDDAEREQLAVLYQPGQTLWRAPVSHFTPWDCNWPFGFPADAIAPRLRALLGNDPTKCPTLTGGSVIECESQALGERIALTGTGLTLNYRSNRVAGRAATRSLYVPLSGSTVPASLKRIDLEVYVAGRRFDHSVPAGPNRSHTVVWDGLDAYGRLLQGAQPVRVRIGYVYDAEYQRPAQLAQSFGRFSGVPFNGVVARREMIAWQEQTTVLGGWDATTLGLGGWSLSTHHVYDPIGKVLYRGDGRRQAAENVNAVVSTFAGTGTAGFTGDGGPATAARLNNPSGVAVGPDGSVYIADLGNRRIRRVSPTGVITTIAGTGAAGFGGDGGPATQAVLNEPHLLDVTRDGSVFFADDANARIRKVGPDGIITTVAGSGIGGFSGDGGLATNARISSRSRGVAVAPDGSFYIPDKFNNRIRRVGANGVITTVTGGAVGFAGDGGPAAQGRIARPENVAVGPDGSLYINDGYNRRVRRITPNGIIRTIAGNGQGGGGGDGGPATSAQLSGEFEGLAIGSDGSVYIGDTGNCRVRRVGPDGIITTVLGTGSCGYSGDGGLATQARVSQPHGVDVGPDGTIYVADIGNQRIRRVTPALPGFSATDLAITSEDGTELYQFDASGRHLRTRNALTGAVVLSFGYDSVGRLASIADPEGNLLTVERDAAGHQTGIVGPFGQRTALGLDAAGFLASIADPAGNVVRTYHNAGGLLDSLADPQGQMYRFSYDSLGRLARDDDPAGGYKVLSLSQTDTSIAVPVQTAMDRITTYRLDRLVNGGTRRTVIDPAGLLTSTTTSLSGSTTTNFPDSSIVTAVRGTDPRWGMQAPIAASTTIATPGGLTAAMTHRRRVTLAFAAEPLSLTTQIDSTAVNGQWAVRTYTASTRQVVDRSPEGRQVVTRLDSLGRVRMARLAGLDSVTYRYDARGQLDRVQTGGRVTSYTYDVRGRLSTTIDPLGRIDSLFYDDADRLTRHVLPGGRVIEFAYDSSGNVVSITPPERPAHAFAYTAVDLDSMYTPPSLGSGSWATRYQYNLDRQVTAIERPDSVTLTFTYDTAGRPSAIAFDRGTLGVGYSPTTGQLTSLTGPGGTSLAFTYDGFLPTGVTWAGPVAGSVGVGYNSDFRVTSQTVNGADTVAFGYDRDGLLTAAGTLGLKRHAQTGFLERDSVGGVLGIWSYDLKGAPASYTAAQGGSTLFQTGYLRDSLGRITELTETVQGVTTVAAFTYDSAGRLATVHRNGVLTATYGYDANGNRLSLTTQGGSLTGTYDAQDRLLSYGSATYAYTANGELTEQVVGSDTTRYTYDALGNLTQVRLADGTLIEYLIDPQNRRIGRLVNGTLVQGWLYGGQLAPVAELDGAGQVVSRFVYATRGNVPDYLVRGGQTYRFILDHLGSVRLVVNTADGAVVQRLAYDGFGRVTENTNPGFQPFGYAGGLYDHQTGLVRFGARDYDALVGRWTAKDPLLFDGGDADLYAYVQNDPVNQLDPEGLVPVAAPLIHIGIRVATSPFARALVAAGLASPLVQRGVYHAHHIVAKGARAAAPARQVLQKFGVEVNSAANGVFLPAAQHLRLHTAHMYSRVNELLVAARSRAEAEAILDYIRQRLLQGGPLAIFPFLSEFFCP